MAREPVWTDAYHMKILLVDLNAKVGRQNIFKRTIGNKTVHQNSNDNGDTVVNFATSKIYLLRARCSCTETFINKSGHPPDRKTHNQIDHILIDRRRHSSIQDVRSFRGADCDTDHYLGVAKVRERLTVSKQAAHKFDVEIFKLRELSDLEVRKQYQIKISNKFAALEKLSDSEDINRAWENVKENKRTSAEESLGVCEFKQYKPLIYEECLRFIDERKQATVQWVQDPSQSNVDNPYNLRLEGCRHFRTKHKEYRPAKIDELETNRKIKNIRDLYRVGEKSPYTDQYATII